MSTIVVESQKNHVVVEDDRVVKTFKHAQKSRRRYVRECRALRRLAGVPGIPAVIEASDDTLRLVMSRLPGMALKDAPEVPDSVFVSLREVVSAMLQRGVARHSIPWRDVIVQPDGRAGMVDFERVTLRRWPGSPVWLLARAVTRFHLRRLIGARAPHWLDDAERRRLQRQTWVRDAFHVFLEWRRHLIGRAPWRREDASADFPPVRHS